MALRELLLFRPVSTFCFLLTRVNEQKLRTDARMRDEKKMCDIFLDCSTGVCA